MTIGKGFIHRGGRERLPLLAASLLVLPALAGCSGLSSFSSPVASTPPPQSSPAAAAAPSQQPYPATAAAGQPGAPPPAAAPPAQSQQASNFTSMFRNPGPNPSTESIAPYPSVSLVDLFKSDATQPTQSGVPHPPPTYTPAGQPVAAAPPPPAAPVNAANAGVYPSQSLSDLFKSDATPPAQNGVPHPPPTYTPSSPQAAAAPPSAQAPVDASNAGVYPSQSLTDLFKRDSSGQ